MFEEDSEHPEGGGVKFGEAQREGLAAGRMVVPRASMTVAKRAM